MFRTRYIKSLILAAAAAAAAFAAACTADPVDTGSVETLDGAEPASLTIDFSLAAPGIDVPTRAEADSGTDTEYTLGEKLDPDHPERMDEAAAYINGSKMECLVVLLIHRPSNRIVGVRELPGCAYTTVEEEPTNGFVDAEGRVDPDLTSGSRARITFNYERPMHSTNGKSVEQLLRGNYQIFAIANYNHLIPTSQTGATSQLSTGYETLNLRKALDKILSDFHANADVGLGNFNPAYEYFYNIRFLMNCTLREIEGSEEYEVVPMTGADGNPLLPYIRPAVMQTLSATKNVSLKAGQNKISLELLRISSRTRVEVKNTSATPLKIHSLEFSSNYTQSTNYLFRREGSNQDNYVELRDKYFGGGGTAGDGGVTNYAPFTGAPLVSFDGITENGAATAGAIVPFANNMDLDHDGVKECVGVPAGEKGCIFDALMYESYDAGTPFTYTIDVSYPEVTDYRTTDFDKIDAQAAYTPVMKGKCDYAIVKPPQYLTGFTNEEALIKEVEKYPSRDGYYFLIQGLGTGRFLYVNDDGEIRTYKSRNNKLDLTSNDVMSYLWEVKMYYRPGANGNGSYVCELRNAKSGKYIPYVPIDSKFSAMADIPCQHMPEVYAGQDAVSFATKYIDGLTYTPYYLNVWRGGEFDEGDEMGGYRDIDDNGKFLLYPVKSSLTYVGTPRMKKTVTLATFSDETAFVEQVREIQRNDFMRILVEVSYNPDSSEFLFEATSWDEKEGAVEFN